MVAKGGSVEATIIAFTGIGVGFLQGVVIFILSGMKRDIANTWNRVNNHYHEVECANDECRRLTTGNVIIPRGSE